MAINEDAKAKNFLGSPLSKTLLVLNIILALSYLYAMIFLFPRGSSWLFYILVVGQLYHTYQIITFIAAIWKTDYKPVFDPHFTPPVDVFITVAGEPWEVVGQTVKAALAMDYPNFHVYVLNDGFVAHKENWKEIEQKTMAAGAHCITRTTAGGAKAGNINNALKNSSSPFVVIFDCDHIPHVDFLRKTVPHFVDNRVAFLQTPQYYRNKEENYITQGSWQQQLLFFGPICAGRNRLNAVTMCGTNMVIRRNALEEVGGMCTTNIAEDFVTGLLIHGRGWRSVYVSEVLAEGLAPEDFLSYCKQQYRWARGSLEILIKYNPVFIKGLNWAQRFQYIASASYYLSGIIVLLYAIIPVVFFYTGSVPFTTSTMGLAAIFIPYFFAIIYTLQRSTNFNYTFRALALSMASFTIYIRAFISTLFGMGNTFNVTSKKKIDGNFIRLVIPHLLYIAIAAFGAGLAIAREGLTPSVATNIAWATFNVTNFVPAIVAAIPFLQNRQHKYNLAQPEQLDRPGRMNRSEKTIGEEIKLTQETEVTASV